MRPNRRTCLVRDRRTSPNCPCSRENRLGRYFPRKSRRPPSLLESNSLRYESKINLKQQIVNKINTNFFVCGHLFDADKIFLEYVGNALECVHIPLVDFDAVLGGLDFLGRNKVEN